MMNEFCVKTHNAAPHHLTTARTWLTEHWGEIDPLLDAAYPQPLYATTTDDQLAGTLTFTRAQPPGNPGMHALWINAVYVQEPFRGQGVAQLLINYADEHSHDAEPLWVYTDVPALYTDIGWIEHSQDDANLILHRPMKTG